MGNIGATELLLILFVLFFLLLFPIAIISILKNRFKDNDKVVLC
jgi:F0F1-type ATP synthase membrane subunit a